MLATPELLQQAAQTQELTEVLSRCLREVPLYRNRPRPALAAEAAFSQDHFQQWPLITKKDIREGFPGNFLDDPADLEQLLEQEAIELEHTSGTSEQRTPLLLRRGWWAEQELWALTLNPLIASLLARNPDARRVTITSPVCSGDIRYNGVPSRNDRIVGNSLFVSLSRYPFLLSERELERMAAETLEWQPDFLDVDPVYGVLFARYCEQHGIRLPSLRFILCSYEFVSIVHRAVLQRAFGVPVFDLYGSTETGHLLMEDNAGQMRPSLDTALLEVLNLDCLGIGDLVVSTLTNPFMPLIRYQIGDLVERYEFPYGTRYILHGRTADAFLVGTGRRITTRQIDQCFGGIKGVLHYQMIQSGSDQWCLRFVPDGLGPESSELHQLQERLAELLETSIPVSIVKTDMLVPESSGKFRLGYPARAAKSSPGRQLPKERLAAWPSHSTR